MPAKAPQQQHREKPAFKHPTQTIVCRAPVSSPFLGPRCCLLPRMFFSLSKATCPPNPAHLTCRLLVTCPFRVLCGRGSPRSLGTASARCHTALRSPHFPPWFEVIRELLSYYSENPRGQDLPRAACAPFPPPGLGLGSLRTADSTLSDPCRDVLYPSRSAWRARELSPAPFRWHQGKGQGPCGHSPLRGCHNPCLWQTCVSTFCPHSSCVSVVNKLPGDHWLLPDMGHVTKGAAGLFLPPLYNANLLVHTWKQRTSCITEATSSAGLPDVETELCLTFQKDQKEGCGGNSSK